MTISKKDFEELTGIPPFKWQTRLYISYVTLGNPRALAREISERHGAVQASTPVLDHQVRNSAKFARVVCYQRCTKRSGMGGNQKVVVANGLAKPFQFETKHAVVSVRGLR